MSENDALCLEVTDFSDHDHWRWRLTDAAGKFLADHEVALDPAEAGYAAFLDLEDNLGHGGQPIAFAETALRYGYLASAPEDCAISHFNLANYLIQGEGPPEAALAHRLAAMVVFFQTGSGFFETLLRFLTYHLSSFAPDRPPLPASFDELCRMVEAVKGVRFRELFERLPRRAATGDEALREVVSLALDQT